MNDKQRGAVTPKDRVTVAEKSTMHPRNPHRGRYDFKQPVAGAPEPAAFVSLNDDGDESFNVLTPLPSRP